MTAFGTKDCLSLPSVAWKFYKDERDIGKGDEKIKLILINIYDTLFASQSKAEELERSTKFRNHQQLKLILTLLKKNVKLTEKYMKI